MIKDICYALRKYMAEKTITSRHEATTNLPISPQNVLAKCYTANALGMLAQNNHALHSWDLQFDILSRAFSGYFEA